jgi:para-aminobenzoate synthetase/4-amino-4-deoxychorismate lyase
VRFKTTQRAHYDAFAPQDDEVFDTLLWNERGELTEFTRGNVALRLAGRWLTPPLASGLLPGIGRARLLREGAIEEAVLTRDDLARAEGVAFFNSLRGWIAAAI